MFRLKALLLGLLWVTLPNVSAAKTLYVNGSTGNDSTSYADNAVGAPWQTIGRAAWGSTNRAAPNTSEAAQAGDTVIVAAGVYSAAGATERYDPVYNPANSGTSGSRITFQASGVVDLRLSSGDGPLIGAYGKDYITWDGFYISEATATPQEDSGTAGAWDATSIWLLNLDLVGGASSWSGNNHSGIRLEVATGTIIRGCEIHGYRNSPDDENATAITMYDSADTLIEHNELYDCYAGIYMKGGFAWNPGYPDDTQPRSIIRYNLVHDMGGHGITIGMISSDGEFYQNIIRDCQWGIKEYYWDHSHHDNIVANNTIVDCDYGVRQHGQGSDTIFQNNIVYNTTSVVFSSSETTPGTGVYEHNLYYTFTDVWYDEGGSHRNFAYWTGTWGKDTVAPASTSTTDPLFVAYASDNFKLQAGSSALTLGIDILDLDGDSAVDDTVPAGAYITGNETIGIVGSGATAFGSGSGSMSIGGGGGAATFR